MRLIQCLLIGCLLCGCSDQPAEDVSEQEREGEFLVPPTNMNLPTLDDWPTTGTNNMGYFDDNADYWSTRFRQATDDHFPFSGSF